MPTTFWRAEGRPPDAIRMASKFGHPAGFYAYVTLTVAQAKELMEFIGNRRNDFSWPKTGTNPSKKEIETSKPRVTVQGLGKGIINAGKATNTFHVSLALTANCGGYAAQAEWNYEIVMPRTLYDVDPATLGITAAGPLDRSQVNSYLLVDSPNWAGVKAVMILQPPEEMTFLTSVPLDWITRYKPKGGAWTAMNQTALPYTPKKLW
jgi:hypothetical protein